MTRVAPVTLRCGTQRTDSVSVGEASSNTQGGFPGGLRSNGNQLPCRNAAAPRTPRARATASAPQRGRRIHRARAGCVSTMRGMRKMRALSRGNFKRSAAAGYGIAT